MSDILEKIYSHIKIPLEEQGRLELKEASGGTPDSIWKSIVAFANTFGGFILFGFSDKKEFIGVKDADQIQRDIASTISNKLDPPPTVEFEVFEESGKYAVLLKVPESPMYQKPVHIRDKGPFKGSFKRSGSSNLPMDTEDITRISVEKSGKSPDSTPLKNYGIQHLDAETLKRYRNRLRGYPSAQRLLQKDDLDLLKGLNALHFDPETGFWHLTTAAMLLFGQADFIMANFPALEVQIVRFDSTLSPIENRGRKVSIEGLPLIDFIGRVEEELGSLVPYHTIKVTAGRIAREADQVYIALREALVNAIVHQDFLARRYIQIRIYGDRLEIENAGYSKKPVTQFEEPGSIPRNPIIARAFEMAGFVEKQGLGGSTMIAAMKAAGFADPRFLSDPYKNSFTVHFFWHHFMSADDLDWISKLKDVKKEDEKTALVLVKQEGIINNEMLREKLGYDILKASKVLRSLTRKEYLEKQGPNSASTYTLAAKANSPKPLTPVSTVQAIPITLAVAPSVEDPAKSVQDVKSTSGGNGPLYSYDFTTSTPENIGRHSQSISQTQNTHIGIHSQNTSGFSSDVLALFPTRQQLEVVKQLLDFITVDFQPLAAIAEHLGLQPDNIRKTYIERLITAGVVRRKFSSKRARGQAYKKIGEGDTDDTSGEAEAT